MRQLPAGVAILSALAAFAGLWSLCTGAFALGMVSTGSLGDIMGLVETDGLGLSSIYSIVWGVLALFFAWGLWNLRNWARIGTLALQFLNLAAAIITLIASGAVNWVGALLSAIIIVYLIQGRIRQAFD
ncbi:MAG: hypothetical protein JSW55_02160 [Chloroflexota bacterium]|nr:MAG: hypothetical protein JSW55_02160 [Chloroflexota bacterium]